MLTPRVLITEPIDQAAVDYLRTKFEVVVGQRGQWDDESYLASNLGSFDGLLSMLSNPVTEKVLRQNPQLKVVANYAVGYNNIDVKAAQSLGIAVANTPDVLSEATADIALGLLLGVCRRLCESEKDLRNGLFDGWHPQGYLGIELYGKKAGIIGMGRIGKAIARRLYGFGIKIAYHNRNRLNSEIEQQYQAEWYDDTDTLLRECDFLFLSCPLTPETHHLLSRERLGLMKPSAVVINTGRGSLVDEHELAKALHSGHIAGAGMDVFEFEPKIDPLLLSAPNTMLLPHIGSGTTETRRKMGLMAAQAIQAVLDGNPLESIPNLVSIN
jgi:glyoxylate reductase